MRRLPVNQHLLYKIMQESPHTSRLFSILTEIGPCAVAFSGGVDSCVLARAVHEVAIQNRWPTLALTAEGPSMPRADLAEIQKIATEIGISHQFVPTQELTLSEYRANSRERCYFCKRHILEKLKETAQNAGFSTLAEGSNADDLSDFRPGYKAVQEWCVRSPLCEAGLTKSNIRALARHWNLSVAEKPSTPCLSSRISYGIEITTARLHRIEQAEAFLSAWGVTPLRVRLHENELARIETSADWMNFLLQPEKRSELVAKFKNLGFSWVCIDLLEFRSGSLNLLSE